MCLLQQQGLPPRTHSGTCSYAGAFTASSNVFDNFIDQFKPQQTLLNAVARSLRIP